MTRLHDQDARVVAHVAEFVRLVYPRETIARVGMRELLANALIDRMAVRNEEACRQFNAASVYAQKKLGGRAGFVRRLEAEVHSLVSVAEGIRRGEIELP